MGGNRRWDRKVPITECYLQLKVQTPLEVVDVGMGGALLAGNRVGDAGGRGQLRMTLAREAFSAHVEVRRVTSDNGEIAAGTALTGVEFNAVDASSQRALDKFLANYDKKSE